MEKTSPRILFISRKHPPSVGGMQEANYQLGKHLAQITPTKVIAYGGSQKWLPVVYPYLFIRGLIETAIFKPQIILMGDGVLAPMGWLLKKLTGKKVVNMAMGLDVTYNSSFFQAVVPPALAKLDKVIAISQYTKNECVSRGICSGKVAVIPCGIEINKYQTKQTNEQIKKTFQSKYGIEIKNKKILLTVGRLVKRKGHQWFIEQVMSGLPAEYVYLIAGDGPERANIEDAVQKHKLGNRVYLFGKIAEEEKKLLLNLADLFVMPNIKVKGDPEGFGIVALEAASVGLPVVGTKIEGLIDAIKHQETGLLVNEDKEEYLEAIKKLFLKPLRNDKIIKKAEEFGWGEVAKQVLNA